MEMDIGGYFFAVSCLISGYFYLNPIKKSC